MSISSFSLSAAASCSAYRALFTLLCLRRARAAALLDQWLTCAAQHHRVQQDAAGGAHHDGRVPPQAAQQAPHRPQTPGQLVIKPVSRLQQGSRGLAELNTMIAHLEHNNEEVDSPELGQ